MQLQQFLQQQTFCHQPVISCLLILFVVDISEGEQSMTHHVFLWSMLTSSCLNKDISSCSWMSAMFYQSAEKFRLFHSALLSSDLFMFLSLTKITAKSPPPLFKYRSLFIFVIRAWSYEPDLILWSLFIISTFKQIQPAKSCIFLKEWEDFLKKLDITNEKSAFLPDHHHIFLMNNVQQVIKYVTEAAKLKKKKPPILV